MTIEQAALAALYPVLMTLCLITLFRFWPARRNLAGSNRTLVTGLLILVFVIAVESTYYGITRFHPPLYDVFGWNVWLVGSMKIGHIAAISLLLRAYWEITDAKPGHYALALTAIAMWLVLTLFVALT